ncbi:MAG: HAD hydrolase-like protein [Eubacteriales bacterium]|nr:HAD hydrolase-like protein [Eubacteriales bacterium]
MVPCIVWDWNGTLLDDVAVSILARNKVFPKYHLPLLQSEEEYRNIFCFPVKEYYLRSGILEKDYATVAQEWFDAYTEYFPQAMLRENAIEILQYFNSLGIKQVIISACQKDLLLQQLAYFGVDGFFQDVLALEDIHAKSKVSLAENYAKKYAHQYFVVGDTSHDLDMAKAMQAKMIFISNGHESLQKMRLHNQNIVHSLLDLKNEVNPCLEKDQMV